MKALTIKQPWANLICKGIKDIENRTWKTNYRGKILIHSAQTIDKNFRCMNLMFTPEQWKSLNQKEQQIMVCGIFDSSAIIGEIDIVDCIQNSDSVWAIPGQWHWVLRNPVLYDKPITNIKGKLSFWEFDACKHTSIGTDLPACNTEQLVTNDKYCKCFSRSKIYYEELSMMKKIARCSDCDRMIP